MSSGTDDFAAEAAQTAIDLLNKIALPALPRNYDLFYRYATGRQKDLVSEVDRLLESNAKIAQPDLDRLCQLHGSAGEITQELTSFGDRLADQIRDALDLVERAAESSSVYGGSLDRANGQLEGQSDAKKIQLVIASLVEATKQMGRSNLELNERFKSATESISLLTRDLETVRIQSETDPLTGISNRAVLDRVIDVEISRAHRQGHPLCFCMIDIDHFKTFNDTYGHRAGDSVLRLIAAMMKSKARSYDVVARYGGEEFALILPNTDGKAAAIVADRLRKSIAERSLVKRSTGETMGNATISVGIAELRKNDSAQSLIDRADSHLYAAKKAGRNRINSDA